MSTISYLTRVEFGEGQVSRLQEFLDLLGVKRPLLCTDRGLVATGLAARIAGLLTAPPVIFDGTPANPTEAFACHMQVRAHADPVPATAQLIGDELVLTPDSPLNMVSPGQTAVIYIGTRVLGQVTIARTISAAPRVSA